MRFLLTPLVLLAFFCTSFMHKPTANDDKGINFFSGTWDEALALAKKENKLIFLDIYASWCGPCKRMKAKTFSDEKVGAWFNKNFINVMMDGEKGEGKTLAKQYKVAEYPTLLFLDAEGNIVEKSMGFYNVKDLCKWGESLTKSQKKADKN